MSERTGNEIVGLWIRKRQKQILKSQPKRKKKQTSNLTSLLSKSHPVTFTANTAWKMKSKGNIFHPNNNVTSHMLVSTLNNTTDINHELLTFMACVYKAVSRKWNTAFQMRSPLIASLSNRAAPHRNVSMETLLMRAWVLEVAPLGEPWWN